MSDETCPSCDEDVPRGTAWLQCDHCDIWFHASCVHVADVDVFDKWYCSACEPVHGPSSRNLNKSHPPILNSLIVKRKASRKARSAMDELFHDYKRIDIVHRLAQFHALVPDADSFPRVHGAELTLEWIRNAGFHEPVLVDNAEGLDMDMPSPDLTPAHVATLVGPESPIEVMGSVATLSVHCTNATEDVRTQTQVVGWTTSDWAEYYACTPRDRVLNVISLEISNTKLGHSIKRPRIVRFALTVQAGGDAYAMIYRELDLVDRVWPSDRLASGNYPRVKLYCLMGVEGAYTDFHVDFAGTSVFYHVLSGQKTFMFIPPTSDNLVVFEKWCKDPDQSNVFLPDIAGPCHVVEIRSGQTLLIPTGWIHAVHTTEDSMVIGGNFLQPYALPLQLTITQLENRIATPKAFLFPMHDELCWLTARHYRDKMSEIEAFLHPTEILGVIQLNAYLSQRLKLQPRPKSPKTTIITPSWLGSPEGFLLSLSTATTKYLARQGNHMPEFSEKISILSELTAAPESNVTNSATPSIKLRIKMENDLDAGTDQMSAYDDESDESYADQASDAEFNVHGTMDGTTARFRNSTTRKRTRTEPQSRRLNSPTDVLSILSGKKTLVPKPSRPTAGATNAASRHGTKKLSSLKKSMLAFRR